MLKDLFTVRAILEEEGRPEPLRVSPDLSVIELLDVLAEAKEEGALVMEGERFVGIVTENDYARKVEIQGKAAARTTVAEIMTPAEKVISVTTFKNLEEVSVLMEENHIRHAPVIEGGELLGLVTVWDVLKGIVHHQIFLAQQFLGSTGGRT